MDSETVETWVRGYVRAWESNDPDDIATLFSEGATYRTAPDAEPWGGLDAIVAGWLEHRDEPGDAAFSFEVIGLDGSRAFVRGATTYGAQDDEPEKTYDNLWVIDLDEAGRATAFTEWYHRRR